jgi:uncharacterized protein YbaP (TraB family)
MVGEEYFDRLAALVNKYGIAPGVLLKLKPWVVFSALTMPKPEDGVFLDVILYGAAPSGGKNVRAFRQHVVADRNLRIVNRILLRFEEQNAFIAIDAGFLPGDRGVLHLLQQRGYRISPVY